jgi:hypothetical protein
VAFTMTSFSNASRCPRNPRTTLPCSAGSMERSPPPEFWRASQWRAGAGR